VTRTLSAVPKSIAPPVPATEGETPERRIAQRHPASVVPSIKGVRLSPTGGDASLVNISTTGVLVKCRTRLLPATAVTVVFEGTSALGSVKSKVVRCLVADIDASGMSYLIGIAFNAPVADVSGAPTPEPKAAAPQPAAVQPVPAEPVNRW
jgi:PilZ domain